MSYSLKSSIETFGEYKCVAENELGIGSSIVEVTPKAGNVEIKIDERFPIYSDAVLFEWKTLSGSAIRELNVEVKF